MQSDLISYGRRLTQLAEQHPDDTAVIFAAEDGTEAPITWAELEARREPDGRPAHRARPRSSTT